MRRCVALLAALLAPLLALATPPDALEFDRDLSRYPGLVTTLTLSQDPRDQTFGEDGHRVDGVAPAYGGDSRFPETRLTAGFDWHFPLFGAAHIPLISDRLWVARAETGYAFTRSEGPIADAANVAGGPTAKSGITDLELAFGPVLWGSKDWQTRERTPLSVLLLAEARVPIGARDPNAPNNVGDGVYAIGTRLGAHWQPSEPWLHGWFVDGGVRYRHYGRDDEPVFGANSPSQTGDDWLFDATLARRLFRRVYAQVSYFERNGSSNQYSGVRTSANPPSAPATGPLATPQDTFPDPGTFSDGGVTERRIQFGVDGFITQRLRLGLQYAVPLSGHSGGFDLPYLEQAQGCTATGTCMPTRYGSAHVDGLGSARAYASNYALLTLTFSLPQSRGAP
jgi:hypothetical protein